MPSAAVAHPFLGLHAVNVFVRDQDRSVRFYVDQLGFTLAFDARLQSGVRWVAVAPPDGTAVLALISPSPESKQYQLIGRATGIVFVTENVIAKYEEWLKRGVQFNFTPRLRRLKYERPMSSSSVGSTEQRPVWGGVFTRFKDVDGNSFALMGIDEVSREIEAQRRTLAEKHESERRIARDLEIAKEVQARLFPQRMPVVGTLEYAGTCIQARQVGGDYHDFLDLSQGRFGFVIADISGKGMAAALLMANLQANLRSQCGVAVNQPELLLRSVNQLLYENTAENAYATLFFAEYDDQTRLLRYGNCGHLPALLLRQDGTVEKLHATCTVLGLFKQWECAIAERRLFPGDTLVLYTDGVTETFDASGDEFGEHRLIESVRRHPEMSPAAVIASVVEELRQFGRDEQHDDITLIVARCRGDGQASLWDSASPTPQA